MVEVRQAGAARFQLVKNAVPEDHPHHEYVPQIIREVDRIARIVRQMFTLYRPEQERAHEFRLDRTIRDVVSLMSAKFQERAVRVAFDVPAEALRVSLPEGSFRQVLINLLQNALDVSSVDTCVNVTAHATPEGMVVSVADHGPGIPEAIASRVFEPFFTTKTDRPDRGLGLGLSISRSLAEAMGGTLDFETRAGQGAVFRLRLPGRGQLKEATDE